MFRRLIRKGVVFVLALLVLGWVVSSCITTEKTTDPVVERSLGGAASNSVSTTTIPPLPEVEVNGNVVTGLVPCDSNTTGPTHHIGVFVERDGVWSRPESDEQCFRFNNELGIDMVGTSDWGRIRQEALPSSTRPSEGSWYRIELWQPDGSIRLVWASRFQVNSNAVTLDQVVEP